VRVTVDSQDDELVPKHCDKVHRQEQAEDERLQFWIICQSQKKEFCNSCLVQRFHISVESYRKDGVKIKENEWLLNMMKLHHTEAW
jgi:hypothetical protein